MQLTLKPSAPPIAWGHPDAPMRPLCALCHGALPEVPLLLWHPDGRAAQLCDACVELWVTVTP